MTSLLIAALVGYAAAASSSMDTTQSMDSASLTSSMADQSGTSSQAESTSSVQLSDTVISTIVSSLLSHTDATSSVQFSDTVITSLPTPTGMDACASRCHSLWENCNAPPDANRAQCMADYVSCVGYNFGNGNFPKTCASASRTSSPTPTASGTFKDKCARKCVIEYQQCIQGPEPNLAFCHRKLTDCVGYNPFNQPGGYQQPTACQHPGGGGNSTVTGVTTITTTYCPPGQSQTTTATFVVVTSTVGGGGTVPTQTQSNPSPSPVPAGAGRFQPGILVLVAVGIALL